MNISDDVLMHKQGFAYLKRWWKNGHWNYEYNNAANTYRKAQKLGGEYRMKRAMALYRASGLEGIERSKGPDPVLRELAGAYRRVALDNSIEAEQQERIAAEAKQRMKKPTFADKVRETKKAISIAIELEKKEAEPKRQNRSGRQCRKKVAVLLIRYCQQ